MIGTRRRSTKHICINGEACNSQLRKLDDDPAPDRTTPYEIIGYDHSRARIFGGLGKKYYSDMDLYSHYGEEYIDRRPVHPHVPLLFNPNK